MDRVYACLTVEHDVRLVALAAVICLFASITSMTIAQRGRAVAERRRFWLVLAGFVTGVSIWTTHFAAMLAYTPGIEVRFSVTPALASVMLACLASSAGWLIGFGRDPARPLAGGFLVGIALALAHFTDMAALRVPGALTYDTGLVAASLLGGIALCTLSAWLLARRSKESLPVVPALVLGAGILTLHFVAMAAVEITPEDVGSFAGLSLGLTEMGALVLVASLSVIAIGLGLAYHDRQLASVMAEEHQKLQGLVAALQQSQEHYRYSVELNPQIPWIADADGLVLEIGPRWTEIVGQPRDAALGHGWAEAVHPDDLPPVRALWTEAIARGDGTVADARYRLRQQDGTYRWFRARARPRRDSDGTIVKWYGNLEDIHEQVAAELALRDSEERYRLASRATKDIIWDWSHETNRVAWSDAIADVLGYPEARAGTSTQWWLDLIHPADRPQSVALSATMLAGTGDTWTAEYRVRAADGRYLDFLSRGTLIRDAEGRPVRSVGALLDITARKRVEEDLRWAAHHDPLTQLPNRTLFNERLTEALAAASTRGRHVGLAVFDLDRFKSLNDNMGHAAGDALLQVVAGRLVHDLPPGGTIARLGGDEFAFIVPDVEAEGICPNTIRRILTGLAEPIAIQGRALDVTVSVGAAIWPRDGEDAEQLLKSADLALHHAKALGRGSICTFEPAMRDGVERQRGMLLDARQALRDDRIVPFYQPKICLQTGQVLGLEALLRWHHPDRGLLPPGSIASAFEDAEISVQLTNRMLDRVLADLSSWLGKGLEVGRVAINGSAADFARDDFADRILGALHRAGVEPSRLELEVTETVFLGKLAENVERALGALCAEGVTIALDDFGTGYASLTHLRQFPVHTIKIDRSFVSRLGSDESDEAIVGAVIELARKLRMGTVAEGVETEDQARRLRLGGCDAGQGYLFSPAVDASRIEQILAKRGRRQPRLDLGGGKLGRSAAAR